MTNPKALKEVYVALGGSEADVAELNTNDELISKIADVASGGAGFVSVYRPDASRKSYNEIVADLIANKLPSLCFKSGATTALRFAGLAVDNGQAPYPYRVKFYQFGGAQPMEEWGAATPDESLQIVD